jgi:hypothetical protein
MSYLFDLEATSMQLDPNIGLQLIRRGHVPLAETPDTSKLTESEAEIVRYIQMTSFLGAEALLALLAEALAGRHQVGATAAWVVVVITVLIRHWTCDVVSQLELSQGASSYKTNTGPWHRQLVTYRYV